MEVYDLRNGRYELRPNTTGRYWLESLQLSIGIWEGRKAEIRAYWLRFWEQQDQLLLWGQELLTQKEELLAAEQQRLAQQEELLAQEQQEKVQAQQLLAQEQQEREAAQQQLAQLQSQLRVLGIDLDRLPDS